MRSAFEGSIDEIPFINVDNFENDLNKNAYFLSHFHGDHVCGISGDHFRHKIKKNNAYIYASKVTVAIIKEEYPKLAPYVKALELGRNTIAIKTDQSEVYLNVTMLPAGHSLGSVMYIFSYNKKTILYTGDFRISRNSVSKYHHFHLNGKPLELDALYVDTTFQHVPTFPRRTEVVQNVIVHIKDWLKRSTKHRVMLLTSAGYGYECVCNDIFDETGIKCYVSEHFWNIYSQFPKEMYGMTEDSTSRIHLSTKYRFNNEKDPLELQIYFSALKWSEKTNIQEEFITCVDTNRIEVCFSTHCGRDELVYFINYFKPKTIVGFPNPYNAELNVNLVDSLTEELSFKISPRKRKIAKKQEVRAGKKVCANVLKEVFDL